MSWVWATTSVQSAYAWKGEGRDCNRATTPTKHQLAIVKVFIFFAPKRLQTPFNLIGMCCCRYELCEPSGDVLASFPFSECPPPSHRPDHEMRVVMREAIPRVLTQKLPHDTVHFDAGAVDVTATSTGKSISRGKQTSMCPSSRILPQRAWVPVAVNLHLQPLHVVNAPSLQYFKNYSGAGYYSVAPSRPENPCVRDHCCALISAL